MDPAPGIGTAVHHPVPAAPPLRVIGGAVPVLLGVDHLRAWEQRAVVTTYSCATNGPRRMHCVGPLLYDVLGSHVFAAHATRKARAHHLVTVVGRDGHLAVLSWAEIDPDFTGAPALLATAVDHHPLDALGPQLVVPADACGARHISAITELRVTAAAVGPG
ncbi:hypothetical protein [Nocardiopsis ansamitocini]|uniref:Uncharacterized protein n=1 Tax=Nocardiopsis ansamitocini TaxID=1670832 RepID=A0A9W6P1W5_9ACTN|nr:hypothetical protein [Nocardiopsis ansamitocini]GLU45675.1 hypothetical protein Nans01_00260 [Nocardiopsis ansamitocini]